MKSSRLAAMGLAGVFLCHSAVAFADTDSDRIKRLEDQLKTLQQEIQRLRDESAARDREKLAGVTLTPAGKKPAQPVAAPGAAPAGLRFSGDLDTRLDITSNRSRELGIIPLGEQGQLRGRFRLRMQTPVTNRSDAEIYLASSVNQAPTAGYVTFTDAFRGKNISFARAYFNYYFGDKNNPKTPSLSFGKLLNPFWRGEVGGYASEIFWDNDVNPEGAAVRLPISTSKDFSLSNTTGFFTVWLPSKQLLTGLTTDIYQIGTQFKADAGIFHGALSYYVIDNLNSGVLVPNVTPDGVIDTTPGTSAYLLRSNSGLQTTNAHYSYGPTEFGFGSNTFNFLNLSLQAQAKARPNQPAPFAHFEFLNNGSVDVENTGWGITVGVNKSKLPDGRATSRGDYTAWITYRDVDADAALGTFADSDLGAGTDYKGYQIGANYRFQDNLSFRVAWHDYQGNPFKAHSTTRLFLDFIRYF
jgi:hypothetical protein